MSLRFFVSSAVLVGIWGGQAAFAGQLKQPHILWLSCEDISPHLSCYGDANATTPVLDAFAAEAVLYERAHTTAGVCAACRSAIITGMCQTSIVLNEMGEQARPAVEGMRRNKSYRKEFVADGKYTVRVLNKALNDLEGTSLTVP